MQNNLKQALHEKFSDCELSGEQLALLQDTQIRAKRSDQITRLKQWCSSFWRFPIQRLTLISILLLACFVGALQLQKIRQDNAMLMRIAEEISKNHLKMKPLDVEVADISSLQKFFTNLHFSPLISGAVKNPVLSLVGGRYCSIQGETAAQLRYLDHSGGKVNLYQTAYDEETFHALPNLDKGHVPKTLHVRGIRVDMWIEKGLVMVMAKTPSE